MPTIGGGFTLPDIGRAPRIVQPVDPLERAIKQAQLYNLQQDTGLRQRQLTLQQLGLEHNHENDQAMRRIQEAGLLENTRHNTATEKNAAGDLAETTRYHDLLDKDSREGHKTSLATALLAHGLTDPAIHDAIPGALARSGFPELQQEQATITGKKNQTLAANQLNQIVALHGAGNLDAANTLIENTKKNPDIYSLIKDHLPGAISTETTNINDSTNDQFTPLIAANNARKQLEERKQLIRNSEEEKANVAEKRAQQAGMVPTPWAFRAVSELVRRHKLEKQLSDLR